MKVASLVQVADEDHVEERANERAGALSVTFDDDSGASRCLRLELRSKGAVVGGHTLLSEVVVHEAVESDSLQWQLLAQM